MTEATLKAGLVKALRQEMPWWVVIRHEDRFRSGVPDLSLTGNGRTSWWEVKFANPYFESKGIQHLTLLQLAKEGVARYLIYSIYEGKKSTHIVRPQSIDVWRADRESVVDGFNHVAGIAYMKGLHGTAY